MIDTRYGIQEQYFERLEIAAPKEDNPVILSMTRLSNKIARNTERLIENRFDLNMTEWRILSLLAANQALSMQAVIDYYMLVPNDVFVHAVKLQTRGFIDFQTDDIYAPATLTPKGVAVSSKVQEFLIERRIRLTDCVQPEGLAMLAQIVNGLEKIYDEEFNSIRVDQLKMDELSEIISGEDQF